MLPSEHDVRECDLRARGCGNLAAREQHDGHVAEPPTADRQPMTHFLEIVIHAHEDAIGDDGLCADHLIFGVGQ